MIHRVTNTSQLRNVYFEDIDATVDTKKECYLINAFLYYYFSTLTAAKAKAKKMGISQEVAKAI